MKGKDGVGLVIQAGAKSPLHIQPAHTTKLHRLEAILDRPLNSCRQGDASESPLSPTAALGFSTLALSALHFWAIKPMVLRILADFLSGVEQGAPIKMLNAFYCWDTYGPGKC